MIKILVMVLSMLSVIAAYVPFRLLAQEYNIVSPALSDDFWYSWCILVWPSFAFLAGFIPLFASWLAKVKWWLLLLVFMMSVAAWQMSPLLDSPLGIPGGGLVGFTSYASTVVGFNTTKLSLVLCPAGFLLGTAVAIAAGVFIVRRQKTFSPSCTNGS